MQFTYNIRTYTRNESEFESSLTDDLIQSVCVIINIKSSEILMKIDPEKWRRLAFK